MKFTLSEKLYCLVHGTGGYAYALISPDGTADRKHKNGIVLSGEPISGFRIVTQESERTWGNGASFYLISDPRGFLVHVNRGNVMALLAHTTVQNGEILQSCVWAFDRGTAYLLPTNSHYYQDALSFTKHITENTKPLPDKDLEIGNIIVTKTGERLLYGGRHHGIDLSSTNFNCRKFYLYRVITDNGTVMDEVHHTLKNPAYAIHERSSMTFDAFLNGNQLDGSFRLGSFTKPVVTLRPYDGSPLPKVSHNFGYIRRSIVYQNVYTDKAVFRKGKHAGRIVTFKDGVAFPDEHDRSLYESHSSDSAIITVTYQTKDGPVTFITR